MRKKKKDEEQEEKIEIYPMMRCYVSVRDEAGDQMDVDEFMLMVSDKGLSETIREWVDDGLLNIFYCNYNQITKIL